MGKEMSDVEVQMLTKADDYPIHQTLSLLLMLGWAVISMIATFSMAITKKKIYFSHWVWDISPQIWMLVFR